MYCPETTLIPSVHYFHRPFRPHSNSPGSVRDAPGSVAHMDFALLEVLVQECLAHDLSQSTKKSYSSGQCQYVSFCRHYSINPLQWSERTACLFAVFLAQQGLKLQTISAYLAAVWDLQLMAGYNPPARMVWPHLQYVLKGVKRLQSIAPSAARRPITCTPSIMQKLQGVWAQAPPRSVI